MGHSPVRRGSCLGSDSPQKPSDNSGEKAAPHKPEDEQVRELLQNLKPRAISSLTLLESPSLNQVPGNHYKLLARTVMLPNTGYIPTITGTEMVGAGDHGDGELSGLSVSFL